MKKRKRDREFGVYDVLLVVWVIGVFVFILAPLAIVIATSVNPSRIVFPPEGFTLKWFGALLDNKEFVSAAGTSVLLAVLAATGATILGLMVCIAFRYFRIPGRAFVYSIFTSPVLVPAVIIGLALYQIVMLLMGSKNFLALLLGHMVITMPFPIRIINSMLDTVDMSKEEAAMSVGANRVVTFFRITFPLIRPGVIGGALYAAIISWNNFPVSMFLCGLGYTTLPIRIQNYLEYQYEPLISAVGAVIVVLSAIFVYLIDHFIGLGRIYGGGK